MMDPFILIFTEHRTVINKLPSFYICNGNSSTIKLIYILSKLQKMSDIKQNRTADELESLLNHTLAQMQEHQKNANYVEA